MLTQILPHITYCLVTPLLSLTKLSDTATLSASWSTSKVPSFGHISLLLLSTHNTLPVQQDSQSFKYTRRKWTHNLSVPMKHRSSSFLHGTQVQPVIYPNTHTSHNVGVPSNLKTAQPGSAICAEEGYLEDNVQIVTVLQQIIMTNGKNRYSTLIHNQSTSWVACCLLNADVGLYVSQTHLHCSPKSLHLFIIFVSNG
jgi:hypothetical protein